MKYLLGLFDVSDYQDDPHCWDFLTDEDKRVLKLFGFGVWAVFMLIIQLEILANPGVC